MPVVVSASVQLFPGVKVPVALVVKLTVPVGVVAPDADVSVTVTVQLVTEPACTEAGEQSTVVLVE